MQRQEPLPRREPRSAEGWALFSSRFNGPKYKFAGPPSPDWDAIDRAVVQPDIRPVIDRVVEFETAAVRDALRYVASHRARGKVVIQFSL